jgi:predicted DNA-binding transcriptional regulator AlpA
LATKESAMTEDLPSRFEQLWTIEQAADYLLMSKQTLYGWRCRGYGPPSYRLGNQVRYRPGEVREWVDRQAMVSAD